jgi:hypothetical protein
MSENSGVGLHRNNYSLTTTKNKENRKKNVNIIYFDVEDAFLD